MAARTCAAAAALIGRDPSALADRADWPLAPAAWVADRVLRGIVFGGFPWVPLGNSQVTLLPVAQLASLLGVYGLSCSRGAAARCLALAAITGTAAPRLRAALARRCSWLAAVSMWGGIRVADAHADARGDADRASG